MLVKIRIVDVERKLYIKAAVCCHIGSMIFCETLIEIPQFATTGVFFLLFPDM